MEFLKSTWFKDKILNGAQEGIKENLAAWENYARQEGYFVKKTPP